MPQIVVTLGLTHLSDRPDLAARRNDLYGGAVERHGAHAIRIDSRKPDPGATPRATARRRGRPSVRVDGRAPAERWGRHPSESLRTGGRGLEGDRGRSSRPRAGALAD